jgi:murein DD-endopeptidase MepM/ murein hydrolase activator NlpD
MILGLKPTASGGLSWPDQPDFGFGNDPAAELADTGWIWPTKGIFTSGYGWRWGRMHKGIDVANNVGTPIVAARSGEVVVAGWDDGGYGYLVELRHPDGSRSRYAHNSRILVRVGQVVNQGTVISQMGSTGRSTGPHLHFEILPPGRGAVNPLQFLPARA